MFKPDGTYPKDQWPVDVLRTDASGEIDLEQLEYNLSLSVTDRLLQNDQFIALIRAVRGDIDERAGTIVTAAEHVERKRG